ncbi:Bifunctional inhibitor/lipid-transfer protein/seed storage 2S albumin superfamily protein [Tripterygium wilfordii]|uniref:Bifunctional inhibitor/lipid-transfer protein/seed storage 2S albumin superfamily protein n=1 Tax=Tripterygium wilfordii TaxID=458696 RepID=A0A7J7BZW4_TRIWF|nr:non-specific lipid transfer protein GPI-anchored 19-like [Tripterygium wilfordii]KAF5727056.1 Bifunctional inhibitor/lipid-transfer protein/seed storage 2S albumin superfamily protein [Tripterygium wilfordii]
MEQKGFELGLVLVLVSILSHGAMAQSGCTTALIGLAPCLNYVTGNSSTPSSSCCSQLTNVVQSQPQCLCTLVNGGGSSIGVSINQTLALSLPSACNVQTPPVSQCNGVNGPAPASSPVVSPPSDSDNETPEAPTTTPSGGGSKTFPTIGGTSKGSIVESPIPLVLLFTLFIASCLSNAVRF